MKVLIYPFSDRDGIRKYMGIFSGWSEDGKAGIFLDPSDVEYSPLDCLRNEPHNTICILGHCTEGSNYLRSETSQQARASAKGRLRPDDLGDTIDVTALVNLLRDLGLADNVTTRIKCMNCNSGMSYDGLYGAEASFATRFKQALIRGGFGGVNVVGYMGSLTIMPKPAPKKGVPFRKFAILQTDRGRKAFRGKVLRFSATGHANLDLTLERIMKRIIAEYEGDTGITL